MVFVATYNINSICLAIPGTKENSLSICDVGVMTVNSKELKYGQSEKR